ncbi:MAG: DUF547 domain-containing protein [Saprospiraceae bacterium]|nr:DUF547 domain-containing protein [Saprospiraceae bacterium]
MKLLLCCLLCHAAVAAYSQPNYQAYNALLANYVSKTGEVNYKALKTNPAALIRAIDSFAKQTPSSKWSKNEQLAFWINAYNVFTIKLITDNYPLKSIMELDGGKTWDVKRIKIGGELYSLNQIENEIIRPQFKDARIHFALNCAAKSCPPLYDKAYLPSQLEQQLDERTRSFVRSTNNELSEKTVKISKIFDWYKADFGDLIVFLNKYADVKISPQAKITYAEYDWTVNSEQ